VAGLLNEREKRGQGRLPTLKNKKYHITWRSLKTPTSVQTIGQPGSAKKTVRKKLFKPVRITSKIQGGGKRGEVRKKGGEKRETRVAASRGKREKNVTSSEREKVRRGGGTGSGEMGKES